MEAHLDTCTAFYTGTRCLEAVTQPDITQYCHGHKCEADECMDMRRPGPNQRYCIHGHACAVFRCSERRRGGRSIYCQGHECGAAGCFAHAAVAGFCLVNQHEPHDVGFAELSLDAEIRSELPEA